MLLRTAELHDRFMQHLARATFVDIATAFVDDISKYPSRRKWELVRALVESCRRGARIRVLVGAMGNKDARRSWVRWLAREGVGVREHHWQFHAKAYIFGHCGEATSGWVGSANLTANGFRANEELLIETTERHQLQDLVSWYAGQWEESSVRKVISADLVAGEPVRWTPVVLESGGDSLHCTGTAVHICAAGTPSIFWERCFIGGSSHLVEVPWDAVAGVRACGIVRLDVDQRQGNPRTASEFFGACRTSGRELQIRIGAPNDFLRCLVGVDEACAALEPTTGSWSVELAMKSGLEAGP